ncbi:Gag-Pol polyprotein [Trichinella sp. T9]|nr:Gag-Pol polyprotein [Trichinella sp. T9]
MALDSASFVERWQKEDTECMRVREWIEKETWLQLAPEGSLWMKRLWSQRGRRVLQEGTVCRTWEIPDTGDSRLFPVILRQNIPKILNNTHNQPTGGHLGVAITLAKVRQQMRRSCGPTSEVAGSRAAAAGKPLFPTSGYGPCGTFGGDTEWYILVVCDYFSKWPEAFPLPNAEARTVATVLVNGVFCRYGVPKTLHSDQCRNFESELVKKSDGLVERMNRTLLDMLAKASIDHPEDWDVYLDRVLLAYRSSVYCTTGATTNRVVFRRELRLPVDLMYGMPKEAQVRSAGEYVHLERVYGVVRKNAGWPCDLVLMQLPTKTKLGGYSDGLYQAQRELYWNTYRVEKVGGGRERLVVHFDRLKPYHGTRQGETQEMSTGRALHEGESGVTDMDLQKQRGGKLKLAQEELDMKIQSGLRKSETERKGNVPVSTGPSPNSDRRTYNLVEELNEPARGSGPLQVQMK